MPVIAAVWDLANQKPRRRTFRRHATLYSIQFKQWGAYYSIIPFYSSLRCFFSLQSGGVLSFFSLLTSHSKLYLLSSAYLTSFLNANSVSQLINFPPYRCRVTSYSLLSCTNPSKAVGKSPYRYRHLRSSIVHASHKPAPHARCINRNRGQ